jgi:hypothetical protein
MLAAFCFAVLYVYIVRLQGPGAFSADLNLGEALYFSIVTMTTTGFGDISPKSGWAKLVVSVQILCGFLFSVLLFSIFAGHAGRRRATCRAAIPKRRVCIAAKSIECPTQEDFSFVRYQRQCRGRFRPPPDGLS